MYRYYSKIFFSKNSPKTFNSSLIFPFIAIVLSSLAIIVIFSFMNSLEKKIINKIVGITGYSRIYVDSVSNEDFERQYLDIKDFLARTNNNTSLSIDRVGVLSYDDRQQIVRAVGISDISILSEKLGLKLDNIKNLKNKILIGRDLADLLQIDVLKNSKITIFAPIESQVFLRSLNLEYIDENFEFLNINAIDDISQNYIFIDYEDANHLFAGSESYISVDGVLNANQVQYFRDNFPGIEYKEWRDFYPAFFSAMEIEKFLYTSFGAILIFVASFNLYGLINLIVYRKRNQLSFLLYSGIDLKKIKQIFLGNILAMGLFGSFLGVVLSYIVINTGLVGELVPILDEVEIPFLIVLFAIIFNLVTLYISAYFSINKNIKNIEVLKSNAITS